MYTAGMALASLQGRGMTGIDQKLTSILPVAQRWGGGSAKR